MKTYFVKILFSILTIIVIGCTSISRTPTGGREMGNTGDEIANDFRTRAKILFYEIVNQNIDKQFKINREKLKDKIYNSEIRSELRVEHKGYGVDAKNYPEKNLIVVSRSYYKTLSEEEKNKLVIHEILGLMGIEICHYDISNEIFRKIFNSNVFLNGDPVNVCEINSKGIFFNDQTGLFSINQKKFINVSSGLFSIKFDPKFTQTDNESLSDEDYESAMSSIKKELNKGGNSNLVNMLTFTFFLEKDDTRRIKSLSFQRGHQEGDSLDYFSGVNVTNNVFINLEKVLPVMFDVFRLEYYDFKFENHHAKLILEGKNKFGYKLNLNNKILPVKVNWEINFDCFENRNLLPFPFKVPQEN